MLLSAAYPTLLDLTKSENSDGSIARMVELLAQTNEIINHLGWVEATDQHGHRTTIQTGLPEPTWAKLYQYVQPTKGTRAQVVDTMGMMKDYSVVDMKLIPAEDKKKAAAFRLGEDRMHIEGMNQSFASTFFYGNETTNPEKFMGMSPRYNDLGAANASNIIKSGTTPNTSIWIIVTSDQTVHGIYPKGGKGGMTYVDQGQRTHQTSEGLLEVLQSYFSWDCGISVRDWRYAVRIQIDLSQVTASGSTGPVISELIAKGLRRIPSLSMGRAGIYLNRDVWDAVDLQAMNKGTLAFSTIEGADGKVRTNFRGVQILRCDALLNTEDTVATIAAA